MNFLLVHLSFHAACGHGEPLPNNRLGACTRADSIFIARREKKNRLTSNQPSLKTRHGRC